MEGVITIYFGRSCLVEGGRYEKKALCFVVVAAASSFAASSGNFGEFYDPPY